MRSVFVATIFSCITLTKGFAQAESKIVQSNPAIIQHVQTLYDSLVAYNVYEPKTCLAIAIHETGWMTCKKCAYQYHNLFGYRGRKSYMRFENDSECIKFLKSWQKRRYEPWLLKNPYAEYYDFLKFIKYASKMDAYVKRIKEFEAWIEKYIIL